MILRKLVLLSALLLSIVLPCLAGSDPSASELLSSGRVDDAVRALTARTKAFPDDAEAFNLLCRAYYATEQWSSAVKACEKAVAIASNDSNFHLWLGRAYGEKAEHSSWFTALGLAGKVRTEFERAVELDGGNVSARSDLAEFYIEAPGFIGGSKEKARLQADAIGAKDAAASLWVQARLAEDSKDFTQAEKLYKQAVDAGHGAADRWIDLASFYRRIRRYDDMQTAVDKAMGSENIHPVAFYDAAAVLYRAGRDFPKAAELVRKYLASDTPAETAPVFQAHYLLGSILEQQGDKKAAAAEYQAALGLASKFQAAQAALARLNR